MFVGVWYLSYFLRGKYRVLYTSWKEAGHVRPVSKTPRTASHGFNGHSWEGAIWQQSRCVTSDVWMDNDSPRMEAREARERHDASYCNCSHATEVVIRISWRTRSCNWSESHNRRQGTATAAWQARF